MLSRRMFVGAASALALTVSMTGGAVAQDKLDVVASFSILGDMVHQIGGDAVSVTTLVGPDGDAHVYEPTPADAKALSQADVLVVNGLDFEGWLPRLVEASEFSGRQVVASTGIDALTWAEPEEGHDHDHDHEAHDHGEHEHNHAEHDHDHEEHAEEGHHHHGDYDPHAWQSLGNGMIYANNIAKALAEADPAHADGYQERAEAYVAEQQALDAKLKKEFGALPEAHRKVVTSHDAFQYFGKAYGVQFIAPEGISTEAEPSAADIARIIDQIRDEQIAAVFVENISDNRVIEQITRETGAKVGGELYSDALSGPDGPAPTYVDMFDYNSRQLLGALSGS
ncbi:metal ABC transporter substrate-binding protein [Amorphus orientalis]|uniref:Zinc/manganese transport system substrate-binding protein n=1 Tax=Amorphus orientalis TaxID=649198 RepID=A0AAE3VN63_9HYPH|nr:metal ABC transporter substrate-binding protein [Amorphus orientalis]MDQ0315035.1 zinc/manganese transport system substrate-binding protein [Amorphus orientalis]